MDSTYLLNHAPPLSDSSIIDLGLSLRVVHPHVCHSENYKALVEWNQLKRSDDEESQGIESKKRWTYVKVNMDGVVVGRKVCLHEHMDYFSLAFQLEEMFGEQTMCGLRLSEAESAYWLFYKDRDEQWRKVGDVAWREFVDGVKRLRIACKDQTPLLHHH